MLIVPADSRFTGGRFALATWALVAANALAFILVSHHDERVMAQALEYYAQSHLSDTEFPVYLERLREQGKEQTAERLQHALAGQKRQVVRDRLMLSDEAFQEALDGERLITPDLPIYSAWKAERAGLQQIMERGWTRHAALRTEAPRPWTFLSYQFLHGSWDHLLGNMVMLVLVGRLVEAMIGTLRFFAVYLIAGVVAGAVFIAVRGAGSPPLVGASGAIAGIMGLFAVTFARRQVRCFYAFVGFVGFADLRALWLLPYWIGWELLQLALARGSPVAYEAHVGGLILGAIAARLLRVLPGDAETQTRLDAPELERRFEQSLREAIGLVGRLQVERARRLLEQLHQQRPADARPLQQLYALARMAPDSAPFHDIAARILSAPAPSSAMRALAGQVREEYVRCARPAPALPKELLIELLEYFAVRNETAVVDRLLKPLLTSASGERRVHQALLRLAQSAREEKARAYRALAARHFC